MNRDKVREECEILKSECEDVEDAMEYVYEVVAETGATRDMLKRVFDESEESGI